jgi:uncharacterized membrane protein
MSTSTLRKTMIVLTAIGLGLAGYLTYIHYSGAEPLCSIKGNPCSQVQKSQYSLLIGIPVALIGLLGYLAIFASLLAPEGERARFLTALLSIGGCGFSAYLTYRELFTLHKICEWCVSSAVLITVIMCLAIWRFLLGEDPRVESSAAGAPEDSPEPATPLGAAHP